jgi:hypothetical protein
MYQVSSKFALQIQLVPLYGLELVHRLRRIKGGVTVLGHHGGAVQVEST